VSFDPENDPVIRMSEVYYNDKDEPCGYCDAVIQGVSVEEAKKHLDKFAKAFTLPVLIGIKDFNHKFLPDTLEDL
jgi:hypothetical protein